MTAPLPKPPAQPGSQKGKSNQDEPTPPAEGKPDAAATAATAANGASVQSTIAAYRSLRWLGADISDAIKKIASPLNQLLIVGSESELVALAAYGWFKQAVELHAAELSQIRADIPAAPAPEVEDAAKAFGVPAVVSDVISKVLVPLAPKFTFTDTQITIESSALVRVVAGALAADGFRVSTPLSLTLRHGADTQSAISIAMSRLGNELRSTAAAVAMAPQAKRAALEARVTAVHDSVSELRDSLTEDSEIIQRLLKGAAISEIVSGGLIVHVTVHAAAAQVHERAFLLWSSRNHAGGMVASYTVHAPNGCVKAGGMFDQLMTY